MTLRQHRGADSLQRGKRISRGHEPDCPRVRPGRCRGRARTGDCCASPWNLQCYCRRALQAVRSEIRFGLEGAAISGLRFASDSSSSSNLVASVEGSRLGLMGNEGSLRSRLVCVVRLNKYINCFGCLLFQITLRFTSPYKIYTAFIAAAFLLMITRSGKGKTVGCPWDTGSRVKQSTLFPASRARLGQPPSRDYPVWDKVVATIQSGMLCRCPDLS